MLITLDFEKENRSNNLIFSAEIRILFAAQDLHLEEDTKWILRDNYSKRVLQWIAKGMQIQRSGSLE